jgi:Tfp pilus assembly protein PilV
MTGRNETRRTGFTLAEALLAAVILLVAISAITLPFAAGARAEQADARMCLAVSLAQEMMEEILSKPFNDPQGASAPGPESGETRRSRFDNVDDYHGYAEAAGQIADANGVVIDTPASQDLSRWVSAQYVYVSGQDTGQPATFVRVKVTVAYKGAPLVELTRLVYRMP